MGKQEVKKSPSGLPYAPRIWKRSMLWFWWCAPARSSWASIFAQFSRRPQGLDDVLCRACNSAKNAPSLGIIALDTAENDFLQVWLVSLFENVAYGHYDIRNETQQCMVKIRWKRWKTTHSLKEKRPSKSPIPGLPDYWLLPYEPWNDLKTWWIMMKTMKNYSFLEGKATI